LGSGEGRPEDPAHAVAVPFERLAHETQEQMPVAGLHERRTALGGDHQAGGDLKLRMEGIRRQLHAGGETRPATLASWRVSIPPPAPSSTTRLSLPTPDSATIRRAIRLSLRKFWPSSRQLLRRSSPHFSLPRPASGFVCRPSLRCNFPDHPSSSACLYSIGDT
jgi:hypothetical protein